MPATAQFSDPETMQKAMAMPGMKQMAMMNANQHMEKAIANGWEYQRDMFPEPAEYTKDKENPIPSGTVTRHFHEGKEDGLAPGVKRDYWVYKPANYDESKAQETALMLIFDGIGFMGRQYYQAYYPQTMTHYSWQWGFGSNMIDAFDTMIHSGQMPPTVVVFMNCGIADGEPQWHAYPFNYTRTYGPDAKERTRKLEYDDPDSYFVDFIVEEFLPDASAAAGVKWSTCPLLKCTMGMSSGGVAAFNCAWKRPDQFGKVICNSPSFVHVMGADTILKDLRKEKQRKDIRVVVTSGQGDLENDNGDWYNVAQEFVRTLKYRGYDHLFLHTDRFSHSPVYCTAMMPKILRWLFRNCGHINNLHTKIANGDEEAKAKYEKQFKSLERRDVRSMHEFNGEVTWRFIKLDWFAHNNMLDDAVKAEQFGMSMKKPLEKYGVAK